MNELISAPIPPENILSDKFRVHAVLGDSMEPTLRGDRDYVVLAPVTSYQGEGIYLFDVGVGLELFRVTCAFDGNGSLHLSRDNKRYQAAHTVSRDKFNEAVVAIVIADIKPRDERFLREARQ